MLYAIQKILHILYCMKCDHSKIHIMFFITFNAMKMFIIYSNLWLLWNTITINTLFFIGSPQSRVHISWALVNVDWFNFNNTMKLLIIKHYALAVICQ